MISSASETLEQCSLKPLVLSENIDRIRRFSSGRSPAKLTAPPPTPTSAGTSPGTSPASMPPKRAPARCHECHGPISGYHQGYLHGLGICQLEHYDLCHGGILERDRGGHSWTPCPGDYVPPSTHGDYGEEEEQNSDEQKSPISDKDYSPGNLSSFPLFEKPETRSSKDNEIRTKVRGEEAASPGNLAPPGLGNKTSKSNDIDLLLEAELAELAIAEAKDKKLKDLAEIRKRKLAAQQNVDRLSRQSQGEGARQKETILDNIDLLGTSNRHHADSRRNPSGYQGPTINEIRRDDPTRSRVEPMMDDVYGIPAFSNASQSRHGQPRLKNPISQSSTSYPATSGRREPPVNNLGLTSRPQQSAPLYQWVFKMDQFGEEYKELVEVTQARSPAQPRHIVDTDPGWQFDEHTNKMYRTHAQPSNTLPRAGSYHQQRYTDSRRDGPTPARQRVEVTHTPVRVNSEAGDRFPGIVPLSSQPTEDREGKIPMSIASHARNLPIEYARSATSKNLNFAVFMYGAIHELHSSRIGITPAMSRGVLEAKLQHLMNVIHVTCLNASATDFKHVAWSVGRTYHNLVQSKVDSGREGWLDFDMLHRGSPHAAEMIASEREYRAALLKGPEKQEVKKTEKKESDKTPCPTWNEYEVEGKCKWEADHPGEKCNRSHYCTYCKKKNPALRTLHQAKYCKRKLEDER